MTLSRRGSRFRSKDGRVQSVIEQKKPIPIGRRMTYEAIEATEPNPKVHHPCQRNQEAARLRPSSEEGRNQASKHNEHILQCWPKPLHGHLTCLAKHVFILKFPTQNI